MNVCASETVLGFHIQFHPSDAFPFPKLPLRILYKVISEQARKNISHTANLLQQNHRLVGLLVFVVDGHLLLILADDNTGVTPAELVHTPE